MSEITLLGMPPEHELKILTDEYGKRAVEYAMIAIRQAYDSQGRRIVPCTSNRVRDVLEAIYGRLGVGEVRLNGL